VILPSARIRTSLSFLTASQPYGFGQVDPEPVSVPLIAAGHFGAGVPQLLLDVTFVDFGGTR
jgi:hypothetical protein